MRGCLPKLLCLSVCSLALGSAAAGPSQEELTEQILAEEQDSVLRVVGLGRARLSHPQKLSGAIGAIVFRQPRSYDCTAVCEFRGFLFQAEPGLAGGQLAAGYAVVMGEKGRFRHFLSDVFLAYGIKAALLRTWGDSRLTPSDQTFLGVEGDFTVIRIHFSLGVYRHMGSGTTDDPWLVSGGVGWGF